MKVVTTAAGIDTQVAGPQTLYPVLRSLPMRFTKRPLKNFGGGACGGELASAFRVSCNTSFAQLGLDLGGAKLAAEANGFGFNRKPPLDISPGAAASNFPAPDYFIRNDPQLAQAAIGQGQVSATTLQMALVAAGIANKGVIKAPHFMAEVRDSEGAVVETASNNDWLKATSPETAEAITKMMIDVVNNGTGERAAIKGVQVAAKTGTAQTGRGTAHAWTIGFAPADAPRLAIAVIIEKQPDQGASTGGKVAAPVAREVLTRALGVFP
jgi:peptidoglycan glycosyltransferase